jgi:ADP-heptose:LPS heptosyltransferase
VAVTDLETVPVVYVLRALGLGDLLTAVPALRGLRRHFRDARIVLAAPRAYRDLALLTGAVDDLVDTPALGLGVNLHGRGSQSIEHLSRLAPAAMLTHHHRDHPGLPGPCWDDGLHEVDRWCALLRWAGISCDADDLAIEPPAGRAGWPGAVVIHPGAAAPARRWPPDRFARVAAALRADGHDVVITGSASERELACHVAESAGLPQTCVLAGELDLLGLVALIGDCRLLISGDTGVAHVATATSTPSVLLFGPTAPQRWGPRRSRRHLALWAGAVGDPHASSPDAGLLALDAEQVLEAARSMLRKVSA